MDGQCPSRVREGGRLEFGRFPENQSLSSAAVAGRRVTRSFLPPAFVGMPRHPGSNVNSSFLIRVRASLKGFAFGFSSRSGVKITPPLSIFQVPCFISDLATPGVGDRQEQIVRDLRGILGTYTNAQKTGNNDSPCACRVWLGKPSASVRPCQGRDSP